MSDQEPKVVRLDSLFTQDFVDECDKHYPQFVFKRLGEDRLYVTREELEELVKQAQELLANPPLDENT